MSVVRSSTCKSLELGLKMVSEQYRPCTTFELDEKIEDPRMKYETTTRLDFKRLTS